MDYRVNKTLIKFIYILIDIFLIYCAIYFACLIRQALISFPVSFVYLLLEQQNPFRFILVIWILSITFFASTNDLYSTRRGVLETIEIWQVIKSIFFGSLVTIAAIYTLKVEGFPRSIFLIGVILSAGFLSIWRVLKRIFVEHLVSRGYNNFNALIIGAGKVGIEVYEEIKKRPALGIKIIGFLDDYKTKVEGSPDIKIFGKLSDLKTIAKREFINKIFITIHHDSRVFLDLLEQAKELGLAVRVIPQGFDLISGEFSKYNIGLIPVLEYCDVCQLKNQLGKRFFDFMTSFTLIVFLAPVFLLIGFIIKADSPGSIFYISRRYGRNGRVFNMLKFRSMSKDAEKIQSHLNDQNEVDGPIFKIKKDPRITRVGKFLRKFSLDELPQIINVLKGDMSLVGPRPLPIEQIEKEDLRQLKRLEVRPGITGLWQVRGRSDLSFTRLVRWDIWYINNWSFWLDLNILFQTVPIVVKGKGAY